MPASVSPRLRPLDCLAPLNPRGGPVKSQDPYSGSGNPYNSGGSPYNSPSIFGTAGGSFSSIPGDGAPFGGSVLFTPAAALDRPLESCGPKPATRNRSMPPLLPPVGTPRC